MTSAMSLSTAESMKTAPNPLPAMDAPARMIWRRLTNWYGSALLLFATAVVMFGIGASLNNPPWNSGASHPVLEIFLFWTMLTWIAMLEGCQISIVGLQGRNPEVFKHTHPRAYAVCKLVHSGANVERFLVGRQFLLLFNGFLVSRIGGGQNLQNLVMGAWEWNGFATQFFFCNGVLLMIVIVALGQLPTQLVAADKMLGFLDLPLGHHYTVVLPCFAVEWIGLTHASYLLKDLLCWLARIDVSVADPSKNMKKDAWHYSKCALSVFAVIFSAVFITKGLVLGQTNATAGPGWDKLPGGAAVVVSLLFIVMLACAEGLQVSIIALASVPASQYRDTSPLAYRTCQLAYSGKNMHSFLVGRQFLTAMNMVLLARVTSYAGTGGVLLPGGDWGMGRVFNEVLLQTGFLGAILVVNVSQLASQVTASIFPVAVINNRVMNLVLRLTLLIETIGIVNACWPLALLMDRLFKMVPDPEHEDGNQSSPFEGFERLHQIFVCDEETQAKLQTVAQVATDDMTKALLSTTGLGKKIDHATKKQASDFVKKYEQARSEDPHLFRKFPSIIGNTVYPAPSELAHWYEEQNIAVPDFLTAVDDPKHVPPHIIAMALIMAQHGESKPDQDGAASLKVLKHNITSSTKQLTAIVVNAKLKEVTSEV